MTSQHKIARRVSLLSGSMFAAGVILVGVGVDGVVSPGAAVAGGICTPTPQGNGGLATKVAASGAQSCAAADTGIAYIATGGDLTVTVKNAPISTHGVYIIDDGSARNLTFNVDSSNSAGGAITSTSSSETGIDVESTGGNVVVNTGSASGSAGAVVNGGSYGIYAQTTDTGTITVNAYNSVTGNENSAIYATAKLGGTGTVIVTAETNTGVGVNIQGPQQSRGIYANSDDGSATIITGVGGLTDTADTSGNYAAIAVYSGGTLAKVVNASSTNGAIIANGIGGGYNGVTTGNADATIIDTGNVNDTNFGVGLETRTNNGAATIDLNAGTIFSNSVVYGDGNGIHAETYGTGAVSITTAAGTSVTGGGAGGAGILVDNSGPGSGTGTGVLTVTSNGAVFGDTGASLTTSGSGTITYDANGGVSGQSGGIVQNAGDGVDTLNLGAGAIVSATGASPTISLTGTGLGDQVFTSLAGSTVTNSGAGAGVYLTTNHAGISINANGSIGSSGAHLTGIGLDAHVSNGVGDIDILSTGSVYAQGGIGGGAIGVVNSGTGAVSLTVGAGQTVFGDNAGIITNTQSTAIISNLGTIGTAGAFAVLMGGPGTTTFVNKGAVNGNLLFQVAGATLDLYGGSTISGTTSATVGAAVNSIYLNGTTAGSIDATKFSGFQGLTVNSSVGAVWTYAGLATFANGTSVSSGTLDVNGVINGATVVGANGTLGGSGTVGQLAVNNGGTLAGFAGQILTTGPLTLAAGSFTDISVGAPTATPLFSVNGNLTLGGTLNVTDAGGFGAGVYRVFVYSGALTDNGMAVGASPGGVLSIQTSVAGQVNLIDAALPLQFWNGAVTAHNGQVNGGTGTWKLGPTNWTDPSGGSSSNWGATDAVFEGAAGTVTVDNSAGAVNANFLQFAVDGYSVGGGGLTLAGATPTIRVGDGTLAGGNDTATISAVLAGSNGLTKTDLGTLVLSGANTYSGGTTILGGKLVVGADANLGAASGNVVLNGASTLEATAGFTSARGVDFAGAGAVQTDAGVVLDLSGPIAGSGDFDKAGAGELQLTGVSSYNGLMSDDAGVLRIDGAVGGGALLVQSGARLQGVGQVNNLSVLAGATLAPGNAAIGAFTVNGGLTIQTGSTYEVQLNAAGQSSLTLVAGAANIQGGAVDAIAAPGTYLLGQQYTVLLGIGGVAGGFTSVTQTLPQPFLALALAYDPTHVYLDVVRNGASFCSVAVTRNQCAAANGAGGLPAASPVNAAIADSPDAASARAAFDAVSGEAHPSMLGVQIEDSRLVREAALGRARGDGDGEMVWGQVFGAQGSTGSDGDAAGLSRSTGGVLFGAEAPRMGGWRIGALGGYDQTSVSIGARASSVSSDDYHLGVYAGLGGGMIAARFGAAYAWHEITTRRTVDFTGFADAAHANGRAQTGQLFGELALPLTGSKTGAIEPFVGLALVSQHDDGVTETGGAAALKSASASAETTFATIGLRGQAQWRMEQTTVNLRAALAWRGAYGDTTPHQNLSFASGGVPFTIDGAPIDKSAAVLDVALDAKVADRTRLSLAYAGQAGPRAHDQSLKLGLSVGF